MGSEGKKDKLDWSRSKNGGQYDVQEGDERKFIPREEEVDQRLDGWTMFKKTYGRWGLKDGEGKSKIETCGGE
jgi:hypothetical protein